MCHAINSETVIVNGDRVYSYAKILTDPIITKRSKSLIGWKESAPKWISMDTRNYGLKLTVCVVGTGEMLAIDQVLINIR